MRFCLKCKAESYPGCKRSFHLLPKDADERQKWLGILQLPNCNLKTAHICSDHFSYDSFFEWDEGRSRRRLKSDAIPKKVSPNNIINKEISSELTTTIISLGEDLSKATTTNLKEDLSAATIINLGEDSKKFQSEPEMIATNSDATSIQNLNTVDNDVCNLKKRKLYSEYQRSIIRIKFTHKNKVEYINKSEFVSDEAWLKFLRFKQSLNARTAAACNKSSRRIKKINNYVGVIKKLEEK